MSSTLQSLLAPGLTIVHALTSLAFTWEAGGCDPVSFAGTCAPVAVQDLPEGVATKGVGNWTRVQVLRSDFSPGIPGKGAVLKSGGQNFRVAEVQSPPGDSHIYFICSVSKN